MPVPAALPEECLNELEHRQPWLLEGKAKAANCLAAFPMCNPAGHASGEARDRPRFLHVVVVVCRGDVHRPLPGRIPGIWLNIEVDALSLAEQIESIVLDRGAVEEHIIPAIAAIWGNEAETLVVTNSLDRTGGQRVVLSASSAPSALR